MERSIARFVWGVMMTSAIERIRQLLAHDTRDLIWLAYVMGIAPWMHRAARPMHLLRRWQVRRRRQRGFDQRMAQLRTRIGQGCLAPDDLGCPALASGWLWGLHSPYDNLNGRWGCGRLLSGAGG